MLIMIVPIMRLGVACVVLKFRELCRALYIAFVFMRILFMQILRWHNAWSGRRRQQIRALWRLGRE